MCRCGEISAAACVWVAGARKFSEPHALFRCPQRESLPVRVKIAGNSRKNVSDPFATESTAVNSKRPAGRLKKLCSKLDPADKSRRDGSNFFRIGGVKI